MKSQFRKAALLQAVISIAVCSLVASFLSVRALAAESVSVLLQKAIFAEETEGNLDAAIKIYEAITKETDANRALVAQAQYRLGVCQLKKGRKDDAAEQFRKILQSYSNETALVEKSRERLIELGESTATTVVRRIWEKAGAAKGRVSLDGKYFAFTDWKTGDFVLRDLSRNQTRPLTTKGSWTVSDDYASDFLFSPKESQVAYLWSDGSERCSLRIATLEKPESRTVLNHTGWFQPEDWSRDGRYIAALVWERNRSYGAITLVDPATGVLREVRPAGTNMLPSTLRFSPGGKFLAYARRPSPQVRELDIYLVNVQDGTETPLTSHPANEHLIGWTPDETGILFTSDRRGTTELWLLPISKNGKPSAPIMVKANLGEIQALGISQTGAFYYGISGLSSALYECAIDIDAGKMLFEPKEVPSRLSVRKSIGPKRLSPNGRALAFTQSRGSVRSLHVEDLQSGEIRDIPIRNVKEFSYPKWSADSRFILVSANSYDSRKGLYLVEGNTGETRLLRLSTAGIETGYGWFGFDNENAHYSITTSDSRNITLVWHDLKNRTNREKQIPAPGSIDQDKDRSIAYEPYAISGDATLLLYIRTAQLEAGTTNWLAVRREIATGKEFEFLHSTDLLGFALDPWVTGDVAVRRPDWPIVLTITKPDGATTLKGIDLFAGSAKERFSIELPQRAHVWPHWFGNKTQLLVNRLSIEDAKPTTELWAILGDRNEIKKINVPPSYFRIAGNYGENQLLIEKPGSQFSEIWIMENFLPPVASGK